MRDGSTLKIQLVLKGQQLLVNLLPQ